MPPKAKPAAKGKAAPAAAKATARGGPSPPAGAAPPAPAGPSSSSTEAPPALTVAEAERKLAEVTEEQWAELTGCEAPPAPVARVVEAALLLLGERHAGHWPTAREALEGRRALLHELRALGPWGAPKAQLEIASKALRTADLAALQPQGPAGSGAAAAAALRPGAKAKAKAAAPAPPPPPAAAAAAPPGTVAALALALFLDALVGAGRTEKPPGFPMSWPTDPFSQLHVRLQQAMMCRQTCCVVCPSLHAYAAAAAYCHQGAEAVCNVAALQVQVGLAKTLTRGAGVEQLIAGLKKALATGGRLALLLGTEPTADFVGLCSADPGGFPAEALDYEKCAEVAKALGLPPPGPPGGFQVVLVVQMLKAHAERVLPKLIHGFEEMAVLVLDPATLPSKAEMNKVRNRAIKEGFCVGMDTGSLEQARRPVWRFAIQLVALPPEAPAPDAAAPAPMQPGAGSGEDVPMINTQDFEYSEAFGEDWEQRWSRGPATKDQGGKEIREGLIKATIVNYPSNPKDQKPCMQLVGGAPNSPCTGIWTSFAPLARPTEVEFEFTINGKVDMPNACVVFTERPFTGALPECRIGVQFCVRGGMQLSGGGGNLVRISNDGKIQPDKWNKVILKIDWTEKLVVGQVDTKGKGYAPAIQTVPFRDSACEGFGYLYIYNTDVQATCWFSSLRVKQAAGDVLLDTAGLEARQHLADRLKQREYDKAVAADMHVGMKMGAISCTKTHGMNLAQEQAANYASSAGAQMG